MAKRVVTHPIAIIYHLSPLDEPVGGKLKSMKRTSYGFTIVELLIVIVVIGILAAISIVAYKGVSQKANNLYKDTPYKV